MWAGHLIVRTGVGARRLNPQYTRIGCADPTFPCRFPSNRLAIRS